MIGSRIGSRDASVLGSRVGSSADEIGGAGLVLVAIIGQSNAQGVGDVTTLSAGNAVYNGSYSAVQMMEKLGDNTDPPATLLNTGATPVALQPEFWNARTALGIEMSLMRELDRSIPNRWAMAKFANGATSLATNWAANGTYPTSQTNLANQAFQYIRSAMGTLGCSRIIFVWIQGENDAGGSTTANNYQTNLTALVNLSRTYFPSAPWIIGKLNSDYVNSGTGAFTATVQSGESSYVAGDSNSLLVDMDSILPGADHTHYTADGYVSLGFLYAPKVMTLLGLKGRPQASFTTSITTLSVTFTDTSINRYSTNTTYSWDFGDGSTSTSQNPTHAYAGGGTYPVRFTVTDSNGQSDTTTSNVTVTASAWTSDATSGVAIPQTLTEWNALLSSISDSAGGPAELHLCQEASGNLADSIGSFTLTASGTGLSYQNSVTGWSTKAINFTDAGTGAFATTSASLTDLSTADELVIMYALINTPALRSIVSFGTPTGSRVALEQRSASNLMVLQDTATANNSVSNPYKSTAQALVLQYSATNSTCTYYSADEKLNVGVFAAGAGKRIGFGNFARTSPTMSMLYAVRFTGAAARRSSAQIKAILQALKVPGYASIAWS